MGIPKETCLIVFIALVHSERLDCHHVARQGNGLVRLCYWSFGSHDHKRHREAAHFLEYAYAFQPSISSF